MHLLVSGTSCEKCDSQFVHQLPLEDPHQFLAEFLQICDTVKTNGVDPEFYRLMLFPFAVRDRARIWLDSQPKESLNSWEKLVSAFLAKFFPPQKLSKLRVKVQTFRQKEGEFLYEAWERYKQLIRRCPPDMLSEWSIIGMFYDGLSEMCKISLDSSVGGSLHLKKIPMMLHSESMSEGHLLINCLYLSQAS